MSRRRGAREAAKWDRPETVLWLDHAAFEESDLEWMQDVQWLTLWNVTAPPGFLATLPRLWALDIRGGSEASMPRIADCVGLRFLAVNQVRGLDDLGALSSLIALEFLDVYGLPRVREFPSLGSHTELRRLRIGSMKGLTSLRGALDAPKLEELCLSRMVSLSADDIQAMAAHPTIRAFDWFAEDVPDRVVVPVREQMAHLELAQAVHAGAWFANRGHGLD